MEYFGLDARVIISLEVDAVCQGLPGPPPPLLGRTSDSLSPAASLAFTRGVQRVLPAIEKLY